MVRLTSDKTSMHHVITPRWPVSLPHPTEEQQWEGHPLLQWQTGDVLGKPVSKITMSLLYILLHGPSFNYLKSEVNIIVLSVSSPGKLSKKGENLTEKARRNPDNSQQCCGENSFTGSSAFSSYVLLYSHIALTHSNHVNLHLSNCKHNFTILVQMGYWGTCWLVDTWPLHSLRQQE